MILQAQKRAEGEAHVGDFGSGGADLSPFHAAPLLQAAVVVLDCPSVMGQLLPAGRGQIQIAAGLMFRGAVVSPGPEHAYKAITPQIHLSPLRRDRKGADRHVAAAVRIDLAVGLEPGQPGPPQLAQVLQMVQAAVPTVTEHVGGAHATAVRRRNHIPKVFVLGFAAHRLVVYPKVTGNAGRTVAPDQGDQVYAPHHARPGGARFATPVPRRQLDLSRIGLVQGGVIHHQNPALRRHPRLGLLPQLCGVPGLALPQARKGIMGGSPRGFRLSAGGPRARVSVRRGNLIGDVVFGAAARGIHLTFLVGLRCGVKGRCRPLSYPNCETP